MSAKATQIVDEVIQRLSEISKAEGYLTDLQEPVIGDDPVLYMDQHHELPLVGVRNQTDRLTTQSQGASLQSRTIEVVAYVRRDEQGRQNQDALLQDIYRTLFRPGGIKYQGLVVTLEAGDAQLDDAELGSRLLPIYLPITFTYNTLNWR